MSEKEFSKNGNIPHVPRQEDEAELLPPENDDAREAEGHEAELPPADQAELPPPGNAREAENHPEETESSPPKDYAGEAERQEAENRPDEAGSLPSEKKQKLDFYSIEAILSRCKTDFTSGAEGYDAERRPVAAKHIPKKADTKRAGIKSRCHPIEAILWPSNNEPAEAERREVESHQTETESRGSDQNAPPENAVEDGDCDRPHSVDSEGSSIDSGKEVIFRRFFNTEHDQAEAPVLSRQRHSAEVQRRRHKQESEHYRHSDPNPLGCLQDVGTSSGALLNQAGAIIGKYIPKEDIPEYERFGTEFGQSLPLNRTTVGSERSISSISTVPIGDVYGGDFSATSDLSGDSLESEKGSFQCSGPPTSASDNLEAHLPDSYSPEDDEQSSAAAGSKYIVHEKAVRQRRSGIITKPEEIRSKSAQAGLSAYAGESRNNELRERKLSKDESVRSEPLPQRKISRDSSVSSSEQIILEDFSRHPGLSHYVERDLYQPRPDFYNRYLPPADSWEERFGAITISEPATADKSIASQQTKADESTEENIATTTSSNPETVGSLEHESQASVSSEDPESNSSNPEVETSQPQCD